MSIQERFFEIALASLFESNVYLYEYWVNKLCDDKDSLTPENLTDENLQLIQLDVMKQLQA